MTLFDRLKNDNQAIWSAYIQHEFVQQLGSGVLPERCFHHYLGQDYLFLIHFARAYALAAYKSETLADIRQATAGPRQLSIWKWVCMSNFAPAEADRS